MEGARKIITKAIYGHKTQEFEKTIEIGAAEGLGPEMVLGGTVTGMEISECSMKHKSSNGCEVVVSGEYEVHIWYQTGNETKIFKEKIQFDNLIAVTTPPDAEAVGHQEMRTWIENQPKCASKLVAHKNPDKNIISVKISYTLGVEIIGESTLYVKILLPEEDSNA